MPLTLDPRTADWIRQALGHDVSIDKVSSLTGGLSGAMFRVEVSGADVPAVVLRRWAGEERARHRDSIQREAAALTLLAPTGVPAPELVASDPTGARAGAPATLMTIVPGTVELTPHDPDLWLDELAERLATIHDVPLDPGPAGLTPCHRFADLDDPVRQAWLAQLPAGHAALELARTAAGPPERPVFSHGDYQHFNLLWTGGRLTGVVDWPMAGFDDTGKDVGHCMLNLAVLHTADRALRFLERYEALTGTRVPPASLVRELLDYSPQWQRFIPIQVAGRTTVDAAGMPGRVGEVIAQVVGRAG